MRSRWNICFLFSIRPDPGVDLGHVNVIELLHRRFDLVLVGLDTHSETSVWLSSLFVMADVVVRGNALMAQWESLFLLGALFGGYLGCLQSCSISSHQKVCDVQVFFLCVTVDVFQPCFLCLQSLCVGFRFERGRGFLVRSPKAVLCFLLQGQFSSNYLKAY